MIIKVNDKHEFNYSVGKGEYELEVSDDKILEAITAKTPIYWYALIDGKLFKSSNNGSGLKSIFFNTKEKLEKALADALYWKDSIIPYIGCNCGYDTEDFYKKLNEAYKIEIKQIEF